MRTLKSELVKKGLVKEPPPEKESTFISHEVNGFISEEISDRSKQRYHNPLPPARQKSAKRMGKLKGRKRKEPFAMERAKKGKEASPESIGYQIMAILYGTDEPLTTDRVMAELIKRGKETTKGNVGVTLSNFSYLVPTEIHAIAIDDNGKTRKAFQIPKEAKARFSLKDLYSLYLGLGRRHRAKIREEKRGKSEKKISLKEKKKIEFKAPLGIEGLFSQMTKKGVTLSISFKGPIEIVIKKA